jgi:hypothetical protein
MHSKSQSRPQWNSLADGVAQLNREAGGLLRLEVIKPEDHFAIASAAFGGDLSALSRIRAIIQSAGLIESMSRAEPATCLCCPGMVIDPFSTLAVLAPAADVATVAVCSALCPRCTTGDTRDVLQRAAEAYKAQWPGLRCVAVTHPEGGRA